MDPWDVIWAACLAAVSGYCVWLAYELRHTASEEPRVYQHPRPRIFHVPGATDAEVVARLIDISRPETAQ